MVVFPTLEQEGALWSEGYQFIAGLDEVGRGAWAGPVVTAAVIFPKDVKIPQGLKDSKQLTPQKRIEFAKLIKEIAVDFAIGLTEIEQINRLGIGKATQLAFRSALNNLKTKPDFHVIDAFYIEELNRKFQRPIKNGDELCATIAAASVIAKVFRDGLMIKLHQKYPQYGFDVHKGYGTKKHQEAIRKYGFCEIHRKSFDLDYLLS
ncbi:MAG: ribonuclease HII [Patescibacteria group bacterium]|nr:ribonuclease HII [Patescibacteria group bacterium]